MSEVLKLKIRRDLSRWSRKLLLIIGLENVGRNLVGDQKWNALYPNTWREEEARTPEDFDPTEVAQEEDQELPNSDLISPQDNDPSEPEEEDEVQEDKKDLLENVFHLLPYWYLINRAFGSSSETVGANAPTKGTLSDTCPPGENPLLNALDAQRLNSLLFFESLKLQAQQQQGTQAQALLEAHLTSSSNSPDWRGKGLEELAQRSRERESPLPLTLPGLNNHTHDMDQPLDLTQKSKKTLDSTTTSRLRPLLWDADEVGSGSARGSPSAGLAAVSKASPRPASQRAGRGYTTQELEAALRDIQSGKLGTRRAAVIYGIPRSTLRNKVYKMGKERIRPYRHLKDSPTGIPSPPPIMRYPNKVDMEEDGEGGENSLLKRILPRETPDEIPRLNRHFPSTTPGFEGNGQDEEDEEEEEEEGEEENNPGSDRVGRNGDISEEKKALKEWLHSKLSRKTKAPESGGPSDDDSEESQGKPIPFHQVLKIPSVGKPSRKSSTTTPRGTLRRSRSAEPHIFGDDDDERQSLIKRERELDEEEGEDGEEPTEDKKPRLSGEELSEATAQLLNYRKKNLLKQMMFRESSLGPSPVSPAPSNNFGSSLMSSADSNGKKSRPKRGKYRNYDRDALLKAVRAVQNGEMSVHRAGSFFGVPHSTLEYKVKERHLLRKPKRKGLLAPSPKSKSSPDSSLSGSDALSSIRLPQDGGHRTQGSGLGDFRYMGLGRRGSNASSPDPHTSLNNNNLKEPPPGSSEERPFVSPFLNLFQLDHLIRQNLESGLPSQSNPTSIPTSLLDLSKKF